MSQEKQRKMLALQVDADISEYLEHPYSPRSTYPFWYEEGRGRKIWGLKLFVLIASFFLSNMWLILTCSELTLVPMLPAVLCMGAYFMYVGLKYAKHGQ